MTPARRSEAAGQVHDGVPAIPEPRSPSGGPDGGGDGFGAPGGGAGGPGAAAGGAGADVTAGGPGAGAAGPDAAAGGPSAAGYGPGAEGARPHVVVRAALWVWDFIVGDDWVAAAGVIAGLGITAAVAGAGVSAWWVMPVAVVALLVISLRRAAG